MSNILKTSKEQESINPVSLESAQLPVEKGCE